MAEQIPDGDFPIMMYFNSWDNWEIADDPQKLSKLRAKGFVYHDNIGMGDRNDNGIVDDFDRLSVAQLQAKLDEAGVGYLTKDTKPMLLDKYLDYLERQSKNNLLSPPPPPLS